MQDKLTGLLVKKDFLEQLDTEVKRVVRYRRPLTLLMIDIQHDYFEKSEAVRLSMGYSLIKQLGALLQECYRDIDLLSRFDGEVFAAALPETGIDGAPLAAERFRKMVEEKEFLSTPSMAGGGDIGKHDVDSTLSRVRVAVNVGVATYPDHARNLDELIACARRGMEQARQKGGNQVVVGAPDLEDGEETP